MYKIIGADQKEYGPVTAEQVRQWLSEGRASMQTKVLPEGSTEWKVIGELPEFASAAPDIIPTMPSAPAPSAAGAGLVWLRPIVKLGAIAGLTSVLLALIYGQPRIFYTMACDGLLPKVFRRIHPRFKSPSLTTLATGVVAAIISALFPISVLAELVSVGTLLAFAIVCIGVLVLRYTHPEFPRPFKTPLVPLIPILGAAFTIMEILHLPVHTWFRLGGWMAIGLAIYFFYGSRHSRLRR